MTQPAIDEAQTSMLQDEEARAQQRIKAAQRRQNDDLELVEINMQCHPRSVPQLSTTGYRLA